MRVRIFLSTKKKRLLYIFLFLASFNYLGNVIGMAFTGIERAFKKLKHQWTVDKYPELIMYPSALET